MAFTSELFDQMRDLLDDASDTQVSFATKKLFLNRGIAKMWPRVYMLDTYSQELTTDVYDYAITGALADGMSVAAEITTEEAGTEYIRYENYEILPGDEDQAAVLRLTGSHPGDGFLLRIRFTTAIPQIAAADYAAAQAETWAAPDRVIGLPVLYAMGMATIRKLDNRQDHTRMSTTQALNGVTDQDIMGAAQMWFGQFEAELDDLERPLPIAKG